MTVLEEFLGIVSREVDVRLDQLIPGAELEPKRLHEAIRWSVFAGGKRVRPAILIAVGQTFGAVTEDLLTSAAAVELIHTYSLIHDDLPSMDDDDLRRGKATCHRQFGEATAILAGDVLQTLAFKALAEEEKLSPVTRVRLISLLADAAGTPGGMVAGQQLDLDAEGKAILIGDIEKIHRQKTGELIKLSAVAGAVIGGASENELTVIKKYSSTLGLLFQITDDLLDVTQETEILGKTAGKDIAAAKATYPAFYGIEKTREMVAHVYVEACNALAQLDIDTALLQNLAGFVVSRVR